MKDGLRIYVIYSLKGFKKKIFVLIIFTFSGICEVFSQKAANSFQTDSAGNNNNVNDLTPGKDPLPENESPFIRLFPNPAVNKTEIKIRGFDPGFVQVQIFNIDGRQIRNEKRLVFTGNESIIMMFSITPGIYILLVKQNKKLAKSRLIIR